MSSMSLLFPLLEGNGAMSVEHCGSPKSGRGGGGGGSGVKTLDEFKVFVILEVLRGGGGGTSGVAGDGSNAGDPDGNGGLNGGVL